MIDKDQEEFENRINEEDVPLNLKLIVDFETNKDLKFISNQMEIPVIKYKKKVILKKEEIDLSKKSKNNNSLF